MIMKRKYMTPSVLVTELQSEMMLAGSPVGVNESYSDKGQLSNGNVWNDIW